jgi:hypothetical protein
MTTNMREYYQCRERAERAAALRAASERVRGVHLELAERYAARLRGRPMLGSLQTFGCPQS